MNRILTSAANFSEICKFALDLKLSWFITSFSRLWLLFLFSKRTNEAWNDFEKIYPIHFSACFFKDAIQKHYRWKMANSPPHPLWKSLICDRTRASIMLSHIGKLSTISLKESLIDLAITIKWGINCVPVF